MPTDFTAGTELGLTNEIELLHEALQPALRDLRSR